MPGLLQPEDERARADVTANRLLAVPASVRAGYRLASIVGIGAAEQTDDGVLFVILQIDAVR